MNMTSPTAAEGSTYIFRLFVADGEQHSQNAKENLKTICEKHLTQPFEIEIVDVLASYQAALDNKIFLTPALVMVAPAPSVIIYGNLSDTAAVTHALRLGWDV